jgi:hypothetical protein
MARPFTSLVLLPLALVGLCIACDRPAPPPADRRFAAKVLTGILAFPRSSVVNLSVGSDAAEATFSAPAPVQEVATWYRQMLRLNGWDLQNDAVSNDGTISIMAQHGTRPLWITLKAAAGGAATTYTLIGAELPQDTVRTQRSGSSMSSKRIQRR